MNAIFWEQEPTMNTDTQAITTASIIADMTQRRRANPL
jgi:hypothetical protein